MPARKTFTLGKLEELAQAIAALPPAPPQERAYARDEAVDYLGAAIRAACRKRVDVKAIAELLREHGINVGAQRIVALANAADDEPSPPPPRKPRRTNAAAAKVGLEDKPAVAPSPEAAPAASQTSFAPAQDRDDV